MELSRRNILAVILTVFISRGIATPLFVRSGFSIAEAPAVNLLELRSHPNPQHIVSSSRPRTSPSKNGKGSNGKPKTGDAVVNTIFSGVYPVVNVTWGNTDGRSGQTFISFIDTGQSMADNPDMGTFLTNLAGSSDTFVVSSSFQCVDIATKVPLDQASCGFGPLYNRAVGKFSNITTQEFSISYFPEGETLQGSMGYAPITVGGLTVPKQEVALVDYAAWVGDTFTSGLIGLAYPPITSAFDRSNTSVPVEYDPIFTTMVKQGVVKDAVFSLAVDRVPPGTAVSAPAGLMALGGLVPAKYYKEPFTSVPIEITNNTGTDELTWYTTTLEFLYGLANGTVVSGGTFQSIIDSGTAPNFVPTAAAADMNAQFVPPAVFNETLGYWTVDCDAKAPYAAYKVGGKVMPMDPKDMIVPSLNGLPGYENVCFSAFADGGDPTEEVMLVGEVWQHGYVVVYDQGNTMLHFADRKPY
jgi:hypothetical protein